MIGDGTGKVLIGGNGRNIAQASEIAKNILCFLKHIALNQSHPQISTVELLSSDELTESCIAFAITGAHQIDGA